MNKIVGDQIIIVFSLIVAFIFRILLGHFPNESPQIFLTGYVVLLVFLCLLYFFLFWMLGYYEKNHNRAVLEEIVGVFGVITMGAVVLIAFMYMRRDLWVSRGIILTYWLVCPIFISFFHVKLDKKLKDENNIARFDILALGKDIELIRPIELGIVVVNYNSLNDLKELLSSIKESKLKCEYEIVIIDNLSRDGSPAYLKTIKDSRIKIQLNNANLGYPKAINQGIKALPGKAYYLLLNPDIKVIKGSIESAINSMMNIPIAGIGGPKLLNSDGTLQYSARKFINLRIGLYRFTPFRGLLKGSQIERDFLMMDWNHEDTRGVDWVLGGCMLISELAIKEVGLMDERFFMYFDDVDWCQRMWENAFSVIYLSDSIMIHKHKRKSVNNVFCDESLRHLLSLLIYLKKPKRIIKQQ